ncbi:MAG: glutathione S-transferase C-terminal domain-containing protein, partial [Bdellovibrionota bacterium]
YPFFKQEAASLDAALRWLDTDLGSRATYQAGEFTVADISLMCFVEWAIFREFLPSLDNYPSLHAFVLANRDRPSLAATHPALESPAR